MEDIKSVLKKGHYHLEPYLKDERNELMWALTKRGYTPAQLGRMFGMDQSTAWRIVGEMPAGWRSPWVKRDI